MSQFPSSAYDRWRLKGPYDDEKEHDPRCPQHEDQPESEEPCECEEIDMYEAENYAEAMAELRREDEEREMERELRRRDG